MHYLCSMILSYFHGMVIRCLMFNVSTVRIRCKPISPCKLWKLQSGPSDQHPRGMRDWVILQSEPALGLCNHTFANPPSHLSAPLPLDVDLRVQIEVFKVRTERLVCTWYVPVLYIATVLSEVISNSWKKSLDACAAVDQSITYTSRWQVTVVRWIGFALLFLFIPRALFLF